ncbi:hypothetical protein HK097_002040 [Rhizophlyctis rosea]|uniref:Uncharacterized protein n=1 Tax=Rhizophlyctis rosea TaxID=64517 RepID=A0AAD5SBP3_9FUNG|nr:hypothetical protein HK097_002040 [Rhizophlyctis rosea]
MITAQEVPNRAIHPPPLAQLLTTVAQNNPVETPLRSSSQKTAGRRKHAEEDELRRQRVQKEEEQRQLKQERREQQWREEEKRKREAMEKEQQLWREKAERHRQAYEKDGKSGCEEKRSGPYSVSMTRGRGNYNRGGRRKHGVRNIVPLFCVEGR